MSETPRTVNEPVQVDLGYRGIGKPARVMPLIVNGSPEIGGLGLNMGGGEGGAQT